MADKATELSIIMRAKDQASKIVRQVRGHVASLSKAIKDNTAQLQTIGRAAAVAGVAGVVFCAATRGLR